MTDTMLRLYTEFADWNELLTAPADHAEEAELYLRAFTEVTGSMPQTRLELVAGGNTASQLKHYIQATLVEPVEHDAPRAREGKRTVGRSTSDDQYRHIDLGHCHGAKRASERY